MTLQLSQQTLQKRVFKQKILDLHIKDFMLGQTKKYLSKEKNTLDIGAATGRYYSQIAVMKESKNENGNGEGEEAILEDTRCLSDGSYALDDNHLTFGRGNCKIAII